MKIKNFNLKPTIMGLLLLMGLAQSDPEPLQDYCIADPTLSQTLHLNGPPCLNPTLATPAHFATSALAKAGNTSASPFGFSVTLTTYLNLPGHRTQGLTLARVDLSPDGLVPPHSHPRASEVTICLEGEIMVGFVDTSNKMYTQQLRPGDSFVFPKGLVHFLYNMDRRKPGVLVAGLGSENPGTQLVSGSTFGSKPPVPDDVLERAFQIGGQDVARIRRNLGG